MANPRRSRNLWNDQRRTRLTHTSTELFWTMSPTGSCCRTIGWEVFDGSLKGKACVGYVAFVLLAHSRCLLRVGGRARARRWSVSPKNRWLCGVRCGSVRSIDLLVSCGSWPQMGGRERETATGNASILAVMGKKDNAGASDGVSPRPWKALHESEAVRFEERLGLSLKVLPMVRQCGVDHPRFTFLSGCPTGRA
jgi:hypothetical protein